MSDDDDLDILPHPDTLIRRLLEERSKRFDAITFGDKLIDAFGGMDGIVGEIKVTYDNLTSDIARANLLKEVLQAVKVANQSRSERSAMYEIPEDELPAVVYQALAAYGVSKKAAGAAVAPQNPEGGRGPGQLAGDATPSADG